VEGAIFVSPTAFAWLVYIIWVPISIAAFAVLRPQIATLFVLVGGVLLLPERLGFDPPLLPPIDKHALVCLCAMFGILLKGPGRLMKAFPRKIDIFWPVLFFCHFGTVFTNGDVLVYGVSVLPALTLQDAISSIVEDAITIMMPFIVGRVMFRASKDLKDAAVTFAVYGLLYSLLCLLEMRLSPQLHRWLYGYYQHEFHQSMRWGGYRPVVFLAHGLAIGMFMLNTTLLTFAVTRVRIALFGIKTKLTAWYMALVFVFCKSAGAIAYGMLGIPLVGFMNPRLQMRFATVLAILIYAYPLSKVTDVFPAETLIELATDAAGEERAKSLGARFENDILLVDRARERLTFGWGPYARGRVYNSLGVDVAPPDGYWVIELGTRGIVALLIIFSVLLFPIFAANKAVKKLHDKKDRILFGAITLSSLFYAVDMLPNTAYNPLPFFMAGIVFGLAEALPKEAAKRWYTQQASMQMYAMQAMPPATSAGRAAQ
jgi:hypothetical protein